MAKTKVLFTPSARKQLLELVVRLRDRDRVRAVTLVDDLDRRLHLLRSGEEPGTESEVASQLNDAAGEVSLWYWHRAGALWVLAIGPSDVDLDDDLGVLSQPVAEGHGSQPG